MIKQTSCFFWVLFFIFFLGRVEGEEPNTISLRMKSNGVRTFIESKTGRERFFHGTNAIVKGPPYIPFTEYWDQDISLTEKDYKMMESLGLNVIRLGTMWAGAQPTQGSFNFTYISKLRNITQEAAKFGIFTLLDMHQDVLNEDFCGEGIPEWAVRHPQNGEFPVPLAQPYEERDTDGYPTRQECFSKEWGNYYFAHDTSYAFQALYDEGEPRDAWGNFWAQITSSFLGATNILGIELINEPWAGDIYAEPTLLIPGQADRRNLGPAYDAISQPIREVNNEIIIFFAGITFDDMHPEGFQHTPGGSVYSNRSVLAYHWYSPPQFEKDIPIYFTTRMEDARRLSSGAMLTEFDRPSTSGDFEDDNYIRICDAADRHLQSHSFWEWKTFCKETNETLNSNSSFAAYGACITGYGSHDFIWNDDGSTNQDVMKKLARTYAQAVAGDTISMKYEWKTQYFVLKYEIDTTISAPTEIYLNTELNYPNGFVVEIEPEWAASYSHIRPNHLYISPQEGTFNGMEVTVSISAS